MFMAAHLQEAGLPTSAARYSNNPKYPEERRAVLQGFEKLYKDHASLIKHYVLNLCGHVQTAEDIVQETFYRAILYAQKNGGRDINRQWLIKTAHNLFIDYWRKDGKHNKNMSLNTPEEIDALDRSLSGFYPNPEDMLMIRQLLNGLPVRYRTLFLLKELYGFSLKEIASIHGLSLSNVKVMMHRARKMLEKECQQDEK